MFQTFSGRFLAHPSVFYAVVLIYKSDPLHVTCSTFHCLTSWRLAFPLPLGTQDVHRSKPAISGVENLLTSNRGPDHSFFAWYRFTSFWRLRVEIFVPNVIGLQSGIRRPLNALWFCDEGYQRFETLSGQLIYPVLTASALKLLDCVALLSFTWPFSLSLGLQCSILIVTYFPTARYHWSYLCGDWIDDIYSISDFPHSCMAAPLVALAFPEYLTMRGDLQASSIRRFVTVPVP